MMRFRHVIGALAMVALAGSLAAAQAPEGQRGAAPAPPPEPKNLKVLPTTTTTAQILPIMRAFSARPGHQLRLLPRLDGPRPTRRMTMPWIPSRPSRSPAS